MVGCVEMKDNSFVLYPSTSLYYDIVVTSGEERWKVLKRFSEVRKFWEAVRPAAAAVGAPLDPFPPASAFLSGEGYTGNLYETDPSSRFAEERVATLRTMLAAFAEKTDITGGSLFDLKMVRNFFQVTLPKREEERLLKAVSGESFEDDGQAAHDDDDRRSINNRIHAVLTALTRSTPAAFVTVFVVVLAALYAFSNDDDRHPPR